MVTYDEEYMKSPREVYRKGSESSDAHFYCYRQVQPQGKGTRRKKKEDTRPSKHCIRATPYSSKSNNKKRG